MDRLPARNLWYDHGVKRMLDVIFALVVFVVLLPLMAGILMVLLLCATPPIFRQKRVGYRCRPFSIYKFQTMTQERGADGELLPDEMRTTWFGRFLRSTSLDELPELINVLKGDMSLIGPRPWVPEQMATFPERTRQARMSVRPGLSGLAQILGRNNLTFRQRVCLDLRYIRHQSLRLDFAIFFLTIYKVLKREGIYPSSETPHRHRALGSTPKDPATKGQRANRTREHYIA